VVLRNQLKQDLMEESRGINVKNVVRFMLFEMKE
jgi:hypothetical protein